LLEDTFDSSSKAPRVKAPVLVLTAQHDRLIPHEHTARLVARLEPELVTTADIADANHDSIVRTAAYRHALALFLRD
jgi:alpha-beta hydrolase superfamily lysophospholipase